MIKNLEKLKMENLKRCLFSDFVLLIPHTICKTSQNLWSLNLYISKNHHTKRLYGVLFYNQFAEYNWICLKKETTSLLFIFSMLKNQILKHLLLAAFFSQIYHNSKKPKYFVPELQSCFKKEGMKTSH